MIREVGGAKGASSHARSTPRMRNAATQCPTLRVAACPEESTARSSRWIGILWLLVVSEVSVYQWLGL